MRIDLITTFDAISGRITRRRTLAAAIGGLTIAAVPISRANADEGCQNGFTNCRGVCTDLINDPVFCGSCDNTCDTGACKEMVCVSCEEIGLDSCAGGNDNFYCTDLQTDAFNCGACANGTDDHFCTSELCVDGECVSTVDCDEGLTECRGQCVDLMTNVSHCGGCFGECYGGESQPGVCIDGACVLCDSLGLAFCPGVSDGSYNPYCAELTSDPANCGGCEVVCDSGVCTGGTCEGGTAPESTPGPERGYTDDADAVGHLLYLETFSLELLRAGLNNLPRDDFKLLRNDARSLLSQVRVHDKDHVEALARTLDRLGGTPQPTPVYNFDSLETVVDFSRALYQTKRLYPGAYFGVLKVLSDDSTRDEVLANLPAEARHAAVIAELNGVTPFTGSFEDAISREAVLRAIQPYLAAGA